jgi:TnpA family transposase
VNSRAAGRIFGAGRGITYYNLVSDQFTGLNAVGVPGTLRDSLLILGAAARPRNRPRAR